MKAIQEGIRQKLSTEEEPYEGEISIIEVEKEVMKFINEQKAQADGRIKFVFDGFVHQNGLAFAEFVQRIGKP